MSEAEPSWYHVRECANCGHVYKREHAARFGQTAVKNEDSTEMEYLACPKCDDIRYKLKQSGS